MKESKKPDDKGGDSKFYKSVLALARECEVAPRSKKSSSQRLLVFVGYFFYGTI